MRGWLNFEYPNLYSRHREQYILSVVANSELAEIAKIRNNIDLGLAIASRSRESLAELSKGYKAILDLTLPYLTTKDKIEDKVVKTPEEWKAFLAAKNAQFKHPAKPQK